MSRFRQPACRSIAAASFRRCAGLACCWLVLVLALVLAGSAHASPDWSKASDSAALIVVAIDEKSDPVVAAGSTPRGYDNLAGYQGSQRSKTAAARLAGDHQLAEIAAWTIEPLQLRCMVYQIPGDADRGRILRELQQDARVRIAQPLQEFRTLDLPAVSSRGLSSDAVVATYSDPYHRLQTNLGTLRVEQAQRWSLGAGSRIAVIDSAVDAEHPDLSGRIAEQRDFVTADTSSAPIVSTADQRHGTAVAGIIAANANNGIGIVGIAPAARLLAYRACWVTAQTAAARCNSFTLAQALTAAIAADAAIINLSIGGPADPLLTLLLRHAIDTGSIVVAAIPPDGRMEGFPVNVDGVIAVASSEDTATAPAVLHAPGLDILTLQPGGRYDYDSGSSLAAAETSAVIALLLQRRPRLSAAAALDLLQRSRDNASRSINACRALAMLASPSQADACPAREPANLADQRR